MTKATSQSIEALAELVERLQVDMQRTQRDLAELRESGDASDEDRYQYLEEQISSLLNKFVACHRLHTATDFSAALTGIYEVLETLVGVDSFAMYIAGKEDDTALYKVVQSAVGDFAPKIIAGEGVLGKAITSGEMILESPAKTAAADGSYPIALVPLLLERRAVGLIAVYRLLAHKGSFVPVDSEIFDILSKHSAGVTLDAIEGVRRKYNMVTMDEVADYARSVQASDL